MFYVYRKNGGQVITASVNEYDNVDSEYFGVIEAEESYDLALEYWSDGVDIRLATQEEKDNWEATAAADEKERQKTAAKEIFDGASNMNVAIRAYRALVVLVSSEINKLRALHGLPEYTNTQIKQALWDAIDGSPE